MKADTNKASGRSILFRRLSCGFAVFAQAKLAQPLPGIDSVIVSVAERELHAVAANVFRAEHRKIVGHGLRIEYAKAGHLTNAVGAHALGSKILDRVDADVTVIPSNSYFGRACLLYFEWCGHKDGG